MAAYTFNDLEDKEALSKYANSMTGHSSDTYSGKATWTAYKEIPGTTIIPDQDVIIPTVEQEAMYKRATDAGANLKRVVATGGGHAITVTQPQLVVDELIKLAQEQM
jgi:pimeloyl-ACP methyl ester carboxylesterase